MTDPVDLDAIAARAEAATPGPWFHNGYSAICSEPLVKTYDAWVDPIVDVGHTLERTGTCPPCGEWRDPAACHNWPAGHGCRHYSDDYERDPFVARVPSHHGDTAIGKHAADMVFIAAAPGDIRALLAELAKIDAAISEAGIEYPRRVAAIEDLAAMADGRAEDLAAARATIAEQDTTIGELRAQVGRVEGDADEMEQDRDAWQARALRAETDAHDARKGTR